MTRQDFIDAHRHEISGAVLDILFRKAEGGELSLLVRQLLTKIDRTLGNAYDELTAARNGTHEPARQK